MEGRVVVSIDPGSVQEVPLGAPRGQAREVPEMLWCMP